MSFRKIALTAVALIVGCGAALALTPIGRDLAFHMLPIGWTGEAERLAGVLRIGPGSVVADIGGGSGEMIVALSRIVGPKGRALATERTRDQRDRIAARAASRSLPVVVIEAGDAQTNLPDACCDAIIMRMVLHHIVDRAAYAQRLRQALGQDGRVGVVDFAPGALPHLTNDHGVAPEEIIDAFVAAGFELERRIDDWGGRSFLLVFTTR